MTVRIASPATRRWSSCSALRLRKAAPGGNASVSSRSLSATGAGVGEQRGEHRVRLLDDLDDGRPGVGRRLEVERPGGSLGRRRRSRRWGATTSAGGAGSRGRAGASGRPSRAGRAQWRRRRRRRRRVRARRAAGVPRRCAGGAGSSRSIRASSADVDGSTSGAAALISASSSWIRASAPFVVASSAAATRSSSRTTSVAASALRLLEQARVALGRDAQLGRHLAEHLHDQQLARVDLEVAENLAGVAARLGERAAARERGGAGRAATIASTAPNSCSASATPSTASTSSGCDRSSPAYVTSCSSVPSASRKLPVAWRAISAIARRVDLDRLVLGDAREHRRDLLDRRAAEVEAVAAVDDRRQHLLGLGRREHEDRVRRRLLERLQERVPGLLGEHVRLVEDVDLVAPGDRRVGDLLAQVADVVDRVVGRGVHLDHVERGRARRSRRTSRTRRTA